MMEIRRNEKGHATKRWGYERWLANEQDANYCGKEIVIYPGKRTSLHYHEKKDEVIYVAEGVLHLTGLHMIGSVKRREAVLRPGESVRIYPGERHRLRNTEDCILRLLEFSTFHEESDSFRVEGEPL